MKAIVLAAGRGDRLRPVTDTVPKCMVPVADVPILTRALSGLAEAGVRDVTVVVGYLEEAVRGAYGDRFGDVRLTYARNAEYATTTNLVSLWLAREQMDDDVILLEGDIVLEPPLLRDLVAHPEPDVAVVAPHRAGMDGTVILPEGNRAGRFVLERDQGAGFDYGPALKTVNIYKLSARTLRERVVPELEARVARGSADPYYEAVFGDLVADGRLTMGLLETGAHRWAEVDDAADLQRAEVLFAPVRDRPTGA
ncbi:MAG: NTP transferase domain-containing protein [Myxococcota bacterium]